MIDVFAHRGLHTTERENTLAAFRAAVDLGVDGVELDVRRTLDGVLVVHHDPGRSGRWRSPESARSALPDYVPTLDEALEVPRGRPGERGDQERPGSRRDLRRNRRTCRARSWPASRRPAGPRRVSISCFDLATCAVVRSLNRDITVAWLLWDVAVGRRAGPGPRARIQRGEPALLDGRCRRRRSRATISDLDVNVWTVNAHRGPRTDDGARAWRASSLTTRRSRRAS